MFVTALQVIQFADLSLLGDIIIPGNVGANWSDMAAGKYSALGIHLDQLDIVLAVFLLQIFTGISFLRIFNIPTFLSFHGWPTSLSKAAHLLTTL